MVPAGFGGRLRRAAAASGVPLRLIAEHPEEWRLGRLTVALDRQRDAAQLRYARVQVARARCDVGEIMAGWQRALDRLAAESVAPDAFARALVAAYAAAGGGRVELAALHAQLPAAIGRRRYSRAQFAWDLARLKSEGGLSLPEGRVVLDVATGRPAARQLVWVEDERGTGQYYRFFRLVPP